ncbi:MAG TPA: AmmeMemoRadiSam system protein B [Candidatus Nanoarchaeia archaeon]|nr:AmmeMemoRadiSam system protein B [Candidatus Nanoarchaeia archaeon]
MDWYPSDKNTLDLLLNKLLKGPDKKIKKEVHGLIVPHAGYDFSGEIAGMAFALIKDKKPSKAIILGPSHYTGFFGARALDKKETPLGKINLMKQTQDFDKIAYEHSIDNEIPFLQKINPDIFILPLAIGELDDEEAEKLAEQISEIACDETVFIFSTDLSHFLPYKEAVERDKKTIEIITSLKINKSQIDACGQFPLMVLMHLCKIKKWKPQLIGYKNSGDITGDKSSVVGYASFWF